MIVYLCVIHFIGNNCLQNLRNYENKHANYMRYVYNEYYDNNNYIFNQIHDNAVQ